MKQIPNILTISRILLTFVFLHYVTSVGLNAMVIATLIFAVASLTDFLDGYLAREYKLDSDFGKIMDPIADKFLVLGAFFIFMTMGFLSDVMFGIIFIREVFVTLTRLMAIKKGQVLAAEKSGKLKTVSQIVAIFAILLFIVFRETQLFMSTSARVIGLCRFSIDLLAWIAVLFTLFSGIAFYLNNRKTIYAK